MGSDCSDLTHLFHLLLRPCVARSEFSLPDSGESSHWDWSTGTMKLLLGPFLCLLLFSLRYIGNKAGATAIDMTNVLNTTNATVTNSTLPDASPTLSSSQHMINASQPDVSSPEISTLSSTSSTSTSENILQSQGTESGKNASAASASSSYSSVILPVVIALIVITLSAFVLVGLYRMCRKTDPGTRENGNDQPQSDKESVKLLTVKTISHEPGEHSAHGKTKN
ncbi:endomucin [Loxodonta africana]|uniref:endomucin n=1 Tax=Loxodonta africana TaxID=9785 RepID=UPI0030D24913